METEKLKVKLELYSTFWDKKPKIEVCIDNESKYKNEVTGTEHKPDIIEFTHKFTHDKKYKLRLIRSNKGKNQTVLNKKGEIEKDQLIHIKYIEIDEIDIGALVYAGVYTPEYPEPWYSQQQAKKLTPPKSLTNVTAMGHNGAWELEFKSPFYMWLLENLY